MSDQQDLRSVIAAIIILVVISCSILASQISAKQPAQGFAEPCPCPHAQELPKKVAIDIDMDRHENSKPTILAALTEAERTGGTALDFFILYKLREAVVFNDDPRHPYLVVVLDRQDAMEWEHRLATRDRFNTPATVLESIRAALKSYDPCHADRSRRTELGSAPRPSSACDFER